jgi:hypothetical protein
MLETKRGLLPQRAAFGWNARFRGTIFCYLGELRSGFAKGSVCLIVGFAVAAGGSSLITNKCLSRGMTLLETMMVLMIGVFVVGAIAAAVGYHYRPHTRLTLIEVGLVLAIAAVVIGGVMTLYLATNEQRNRPKD